MKKTTLLKSIAIGLFTILMVFNITMTIHDNGAAGVDLSLSGLQALAQGGGEEGGVCQYDSDCPSGICEKQPGQMYGTCVTGNRCYGQFTIAEGESVRFCGTCFVMNGYSGTGDYGTCTY